MLKRIVIGCICLCASFSQADTSMNTLVKDYPHSVCQKKLIDLANKEIRVLKHRLHSVHEEYKTNADGIAITPFSVFGVVDYHDRSQLVNFIATPVSNEHCDVQIIKQYVIDNPCVRLREDSFKRWSFLGKLSDGVFVLKRNRRENETAYLGHYAHGTQCQIMIQQSYSSFFKQ